MPPVLPAARTREERPPGKDPAARSYGNDDRFRALAENATHAIILINADSVILFANPATERIFGYRPAELEGQSLTMLMPERFRKKHRAGITRYMQTGERHIPWSGVELPGLTKDGREIPLEISFGDYESEGQRFVSGIITDISDRKAREEELHATVQRLHLHVEQTPLGAIDLNPELRVISWNPSAERIFGYTAEEAEGQHIGLIVPEADRPEVEKSFRELLDQQNGSRSKRRHVTKEGRPVTCEWYSTALVDAEGKVIGAASLVEDVTERADVEEQAQRQLQQLNALRTIDLAITASLDLRVTLNVLLDQVVSQLGVDAATILLLNPHTQRLEFTASRGFRTTAIQRSDLLLGECSAGRAARERRTLSVPNLEHSDQFTRAELLKGEEFVTHFSTPLVAKGKVAGVLEVFHRSPLHPPTEWLGFFEALAGQAAIAVESAKLFEELQQSNLELVLAYDTTLEGWAHALDLRDSVTEGHSRRVTEMTVRLARALGVEDSELVNIRRGALLHDIGKMGIPDSILNKPGELTAEEWEVMRKHPTYGYELLAPIEFLRPALDIPRSHHERWDGAGYPQGLKGNAIPLAARIFAVVDVWDALRSDRPYHKAWPEENVREELRSLAGSQLDPEVVDAFLSVDW